MKALGHNRIEFPETAEERQEWVPYARYTALHRNVLVYAHTREEGAWCAYVFPVPGIRHRDELYLWEREGEKLPSAVAQALFPDFTGIPYAV